MYPGTTTSQLSLAGLAELRATGHTSLTFIDDGTGGLDQGGADALLEKMISAAGGSAVSTDSTKKLLTKAVAQGGAGFTSPAP